MCFISRLFIYSMFYSFVDLSINGHGSVASWRSSRADVFFWSPVALAETGPRLMEGPQHKEGGATQGSARVTWTRRRQPQQCRQHGRAHLQPIPWQEVWRARAEWGGRITRSLRSYKESYKDKSVLRIYPMLLCCGAALQRTSGGRQIKREDSPTKVMDHQTAPSVTPILLRQPQEEAKLSPFSRFFFKSQLLQKI